MLVIIFDIIMRATGNSPEEMQKRIRDWRKKRTDEMEHELNILKEKENTAS